MAKTSGNIKTKSRPSNKEKGTKPAKEVKTGKPEPKQQEVAISGFSFERMNYLLMLAGLAVIIIGFFLMTGSSNNDPAVFNEDIYSFRRITLAPIVIVIGFIIEIIAIMWKPRK